MLHSDLATTFRDRAVSGKVCLGIHTSAMSPQLVELYGTVGVDFVIIGGEVESLDLGRMEDMIRAADASRTVPIVKLKRPDVHLIAEAMNAGAPMVMVPHVTNRKQLEHMVRGSQFEPEGLRGECPISRYNGYGALDLAANHDLANKAHAIIPIIEDKEALDNLDDIMQVKEIDIVEIGPYDLSRSLGEVGEGFNGPKTMAAIEKVCEYAAKYKKAVLTPLWYTTKTQSYTAIIEHQMNELLSRGINCVYELETAFLALHMSRLALLRRVQTVEEEPAPAPEPVAAAPASNGKAAKSNGKAAKPATNGKTAKPAATNGKAAKPASNGKAAKPAAKPAPKGKRSSASAR